MAEIPSTVLLGARWGRRVLSAELQRTVEGDLNVREAKQAAEQILVGNARRLYGLSP